MKKLFLIIGLLLSAGALNASDRNDMASLWDEANTSYINGDFGGAIVLYDSIVNQGYASGKLYYNLANAHFKNNSIGKAIVNYNRALKLSPYDKDIQYNLAVANSYIKDRIEPVPEFFLSGWIRGVRGALSSNVWAFISIIMFAAALAGILLYMHGNRKGYRKGGFFGAIFFLIVFVMSVCFSVIEKRELLDASQAVVITSAASVKSSPEKSGKDIFIVHEGTKVDVLNDHNGWTEIMIADGNKGWILDQAIELID